jgi:hypoxanthine phosphoribosyltransferase
MHTIPQVIVGLITGSLYAVLYWKLNSPLYILVTSLCIAFTLILLILITTDIKVRSAQIPAWVDKKLYYIVDKKMNIPFWGKLCHMHFATYSTASLYCPWSKMESYLDSWIEKNTVNYDAVIGIKSGGAIVSNYLAAKLNKPNYYIKVAKVCNKTLYESAMEMVGTKDVYKLCEDFPEDIVGKRVLLVDESLSTGKSFQATIKYILENKKPMELHALTYTSWIIPKFPVEIVDPNHYIIFPWGYDN